MDIREMPKHVTFDHFGRRRSKRSEGREVGLVGARSGVDIEYISEGGSVGARLKMLSTREAERLYPIRSLSVVYRQMGRL
jgi:hypothetical protein